MADIQRACAATFGVTLADLLSARKDRHIARPRQVAMYLCRILTSHSLPAIGRYFNNRDHSSIARGIANIEKLMRDDQDFAAQVRRAARMVELDIASRNAALRINLRPIRVAWGLTVMERTIERQRCAAQRRGTRDEELARGSMDRHAR